MTISAYPDKLANAMGELKDLLSAFSEEIRLRIVVLLRGSSLCVTCLVHVFGLPQSTVSRHLSHLRKSGIVKTERNGTNCYYSLNLDGTRALLKQRLVNAYYESLVREDIFRADRLRLHKVMKECAGDCDVCNEP